MRPSFWNEYCFPLVNLRVLRGLCFPGLEEALTTKETKVHEEVMAVQATEPEFGGPAFENPGRT